MRKIILCLIAAMCASSVGFAQPLVLEQADNVLQPKTLEAGLLDLAYFNDVTKITDDAGNVGTQITTSGFAIPLYFRYGISSKAECSLSIPYNSVSTKIDITGGASSTTDSSGMGDPVLEGKLSVLSNDCQIRKRGSHS